MPFSDVDPLVIPKGFDDDNVIKGWFAWFAWAIVHIYLLVGFQHRLIVSTQWLWRYLTYERGARVISGGDEDARESAAKPEPYDR